VGCCTAGNSIFSKIQDLWFSKQVHQQPIDPAPIFVVGHWRSGTTLLHELLSLDTHFAYSSTVECFAPNHFLLTEPLLKPILRALLPAKRPMDNMQTGPDLPQEDEFALIGLGAPTPYLKMAYPNLPCDYDCLLNMKDVPEKVEEDFERELTFFLKALMLKKQKQLVLKSPTHTGRVGWLADRYPGSRFIHISRNPIDIFQSTKRLWQRLDEVQGFQAPRYSDQELEDRIFSNYHRMYEGYLRGRTQIPSDQLIEITFEDLVNDPMKMMAEIYDQLSLGDFSQVSARIAKNMEGRTGYRAATYKVPPEVQSKVLDQWSDYCQAFGYQLAQTA